MKRFRLLTAVALIVALPACDDGTTAPPKGSIEGLVDVEGFGVDGATVTLSDGKVATTQNGGTYRFIGVEAGTYRVWLSNLPDDANFADTESSVVVSTNGQVVAVNFTGTYIRTASIIGRVSVEDNAVPGVTVRLTGISDASTTTDENGAYQFSGLRKGAYTVEISDFAGDEIGFSNTSQTTSVGVGESKVLSFDGAYLRTAGIIGEVTGTDQGLAGITVSLTDEGGGQEERSTTTDDLGQYGFDQLRAGDYTVTISGWDAERYRFEETVKTVSVIQNEKSTANFRGVYLRSASVSGVLFLDEAEKDDIYDPIEEETLDVSGVRVVLNGPEISDQTIVLTNESGEFLFDSLAAGSYRVLFSPEQDSAVVANKLQGVKHGGSVTGELVTIEDESQGSVNIPFDVTHQTVHITARLGDGKDKVGGPIAGAKVSLYANANNAIAGESALGSATTDSKGVATILFSRADDDDNIVFSVLNTLGNSDLVLVGDDFVPVAYSNVARSVTSEAYKALNTRVTAHVNIFNIRTRVGGGVPREGWVTDGRTDTGDSAVVELGGASNASGRSTFTATRDADSLPATYYIGLADNRIASDGQKFTYTVEPSSDGKVQVGDDGNEYLTFVHDGLTPPGETINLGLLRIRFTTQRLIVAAHYEQDHIPGFSFQGSLLGNDDRGRGEFGPAQGAYLAGDAYLYYRDETTGDDILYENDDESHDINVAGNPRAFAFSGRWAGFAIFHDLPADTQFVLQFKTANGYQVLGSGLIRTWQTTSQGFFTGVFGSESGLGPNVFYCPEAVTVSVNDCSTFGYVRSDRNFLLALSLQSIQSVRVPRAKWTLVPAPIFNLSSSSNRIVYSTDTSTVGDRWGRARYGGFLGFPEGMYFLYAESDHEDYDRLVDDPYILRIKSTDISSVTGNRITTQTVNDTFGIYLNTSISGTAANDRNGDDSVDPGETHAGIKMDLYRRIGRGRYTVVGSDTTGADGTFSFTRVPEGIYFVGTNETDVYVWSGDRNILGALIQETPLVRTIFSTMRPGSGDVSSGTTLPHWNYSTSTVEGRPGFDAAGRQVAPTDVDFIVLFKDGMLSGRVSPVAKSDSARSVVISALRCEEVDTSGTPDKCLPGKYDDPVGIHASPEKGGGWKMEGLREGYYELRIAVSSDYAITASETPKLVKLEGQGARASMNYTIRDPS